MRACCACSRYPGCEPNVSGHRFPQDEELSNIWAKNIGIQKIIDCSIRERFSKYILCSYHFERAMFSHGLFGTRLKKGSVPTVFEPNAPKIKRQQRTIISHPAILGKDTIEPENNMICEFTSETFLINIGSEITVGSSNDEDLLKAAEMETTEEILKTSGEEHNYSRKDVKVETCDFSSQTKMKSSKIEIYKRHRKTLQRKLKQAELKLYIKSLETAQSGMGNKSNCFEVLKDVCKVDLPKYMRNILRFAGYDSLENLCKITETDISQIERFAREDLLQLLDKKVHNFSEYFGVYHKTVNSFKFPPGHKKLLESVPQAIIRRKLVSKTRKLPSKSKHNANNVKKITKDTSSDESDITKPSTFQNNLSTVSSESNSLLKHLLIKNKKSPTIPGGTICVLSTL